MSKIFYDHLIDLTDVEKTVKKNVKNPEAREEIYSLIDEIVHHRVVGCILDNLPEHHHEEFIDHVTKRPHDEGILDFLRVRVVNDLETFLKEEVLLLSSEIMALVSQEKKPARKSASQKN